MRKIVKQLQHDHHHFHQFIEVMREQINALEVGQASDYPWLIDGMQFLKRYLDTVHQPLEDIFHEKLLQRSGRAYHLLKPLLVEDRLKFENRCERFTDILNGAMNGYIVSRETSAAYGKQAIEYLQRQIAFEEKAVIPFAGHLFKQDDWLSLSGSIREWQEKNTIENALKDECGNIMGRVGVSMH